MQDGSLSDRVLLLEHQNRRLAKQQWVVFAVAAIVIALACQQGTVGASSNEVVKAEALEIVDATGRVRARLGFDESSAGLAVFDKEKRKRLFVGLEATEAEEEATGLVLLDAKGKHRLNLLHSPGTSALLFLDAEGKRRLSMIDSDAGQILMMTDADGRKRAKMFSDGTVGGISFLDADGMERAKVGMDAAGKGAVLTFDGKGRVTFSSLAAGPR